VTKLLLAEFSESSRFVEAARRASARYRLVDAFTPFPVEAVNGLFHHRGSRIRLAMFIGGAAAAIISYALEYYSAAIDYPYNSGGRPLNAWPAFMLVPFAIGILIAAIAGFSRFLTECGLPRLYHPLFAVEGFERASQDRFVLAIAGPEGDEENLRAIDFLRGAGAAAIREVEQEP
jgi:Alternative complex III, ActD subunit